MPSFSSKVHTTYEVVSGPKQDYDVQSKIASYVKRLKAYLRDQEEDLVWAALEMEGTPRDNTTDDMKKTWFWTKEGSLMLNAQKVVSDLDFWILFRAKGMHGHITRSKTTNTSMIVFSILKAPFNPDHLALRLDDKAFAHEFTHHLDVKRAKDSGKGSAKILKDKGEESYFNDPFEYNAYYQESLNTLHFLLETDKIPKEKKEELLGLQFADFKKRVLEQNFPPTFLKYLTPKYMQKLVKRLYQFWQWHHKKLAAQ